MDFFPIFLSVVVVNRNRAERLESEIRAISASLNPLVSDYELIIVDNASTDGSLEVLKKLTAPEGLPNLQVYALAQEVDRDTACWVGLENSLGDFVAVFNPTTDDINLLPEMLDHAANGADVVLASNQQRPQQGLAYRIASAVFDALYKWFTGTSLVQEAPLFRLLSKRVVNFILQHPQPVITYRRLPISGRFSRVHLRYQAPFSDEPKKSLGESIDRGVKLLVSTTRAPMRIVTSLSLFGAAANLLYSAYVIAIALFKRDVAPGWISLSLQQSGMFFLISLVLLVLGEYILHMVSLSNEGPLYYVAEEFTSARITRHKRLNVEESALSSNHQ